MMQHRYAHRETSMTHFIRSARVLKKTAFTLIELLVVIAVIAALASLMIPSMSSSRERARMSYCANNLNQLGKALVAYTDEHNDRLPPVSINTSASAWDMALMPYIGWATNLFCCPSDPYPRKGAPMRSYAVNGGVNYFADSTKKAPFGGYNRNPPPLRMADLDYNKGEMILIGERPGDSTANRALVGRYSFCGLDQIFSKVHNRSKGGNYLMSSLSVQYHETNALKTTLAVNYWTLHVQ